MALSRTDPQTTSVRELMTTPVEMATRRTGAGEALTTMLEPHFRHLPVADDDGKLLGILSIRNLLEWRVDDLSRELESLEQYVSNEAPAARRSHKIRFVPFDSYQVCLQAYHPNRLIREPLGADFGQSDSPSE